MKLHQYHTNTSSDWWYKAHGAIAKEIHWSTNMQKTSNKLNQEGRAKRLCWHDNLHLELCQGGPVPTMCHHKLPTTIVISLTFDNFWSPHSLLVAKMDAACSYLPYKVPHSTTALPPTTSFQCMNIARCGPLGPTSIRQQIKCWIFTSWPRAQSTQPAGLCFSHLFFCWSVGLLDCASPLITCAIIMSHTVLPWTLAIQKDCSVKLLWVV